MELKSNLSIFFNDVINFFRGGRVLGIDIGTVSIKIVELSKKTGKFVLENYGLLESRGYLERSNEAIQTSSLKIVEKDVIEKLKILLNEVKPKSKIAFVSFPSFSAFSTTFEMPLLSYEETAKAVNFKARQYIPLPISEVSIEWLKTTEFETERGQRYQRILINAIPNEIIRKYKFIFRKVGLILTAMEIDSYSVVRALLSTDSPPTLIFDIGAESTNIMVAEGNVLQYINQTDYAGAYLTQAVARSLSISPRRAEELKRRRGILGKAGEYELSTALFPFLDVIIQEGNRVRSEYERLYHKKVERVMLVGGSANLPGLEHYVSSQLNLTLSEPLLFTNIEYPLELEPVIKDLSRNLASAVGSALKGLM